MGAGDAVVGVGATEIAKLLRQVTEGKETAIGVVKELTGENPGTAVTFSLRDVPKARAESGARAHTLHDVNAVVDYAKKYQTDDSVLFCDAATGRMTLVLDEKAPKGIESISIEPVLHPQFTPWRNLLGKQLRPEDFAAFVMENRRVIAAPDGKTLSMMFAQVRSSTKITVDRGRGATAKNGIVCETVIKGKGVEKGVEESELPEMLTLNVPIYVGTEDREIEIDIDVTSVGDANNPGIAVKMTAGRLLLDQLEAFEEMRGSIASALPQLTIVSGREMRGDWPKEGD